MKSIAMSITVLVSAMFVFLTQAQANTAAQTARFLAFALLESTESIWTYRYHLIVLTIVLSIQWALYKKVSQLVKRTDRIEIRMSKRWGRNDP